MFGYSTSFTTRYASIVYAMVQSVCVSVTSRCFTDSPISTSCLRQTRCITANVLQPNQVDAHCGKLAMGLN